MRRIGQVCWGLITAGLGTREGEEGVQWGNKAGMGGGIEVVKGSE